MRLAGEKYLPKEPKENKDKYAARVNMSFLDNRFKPAVNNVKGKIFQKPISVSGFDTLQEWIDNCDLQGRDVNEFFGEVLVMSLRRGLTHVLMDAPRADGVKTLKDQAALNVRPYLVHIDPRNVIDWDIETVNNIPTLTMVKIEETSIERDLEGNQEQIKRIRKIEKGEEEQGCTFSLYEQDAGSWIEIYSGKIDYPEIPLFTYYTNRHAAMEASSFFEDLCWTNLNHWQSSSDQSNILHTVRVPRMFGKGLKAEEIDAMREHGVAKGVWSTNEDASLSWIEAKGESIAHGERDLRALEERMQAQSLEPMTVKRSGNTTATSDAISSSKSNTVIMDWAQDLQKFVKQTLDAMAAFAKINAEADVVVNDDYSVITKGPEKSKELREFTAEQAV